MFQLFESSALCGPSLSPLPPPPQHKGQRQASTLGADIHSPRSEYSGVKSLILHWQEVPNSNGGSYGPAQEAEKMKETFANLGWRTEDFVIPLDDSSSRTSKFLKTWVDTAGHKELLVVYYVGHGCRSSKGPTPWPFGIAAHESHNAIIDWPAIRSILEAAQGDVVVFLNCCHGADAWTSRDLRCDKFKGRSGKVMVCLHEPSPDTASQHDLNSASSQLLSKTSLRILRRGVHSAHY
ncbi:hypothetical protein GGS26DRAFT_576928 [Hypomontagnella submonticulosa]|nr:hypothetical protein GGS26DRAFT_576928 [Hypomontagnella submonticulosa]